MAKPSADSLSVATVSIPVRATPPKDLTPRQAEIWVDVASTKPPEWFESDSIPLLRAYVVAADMHERATKEIQESGVLWHEQKALLDIQEKQARLLANLGAKMRLTQQSRYTPGAAATANKKAASGKKPWD